mgnify:CR=1 FL=1
MATSGPPAEPLEQRLFTAPAADELLAEFAALPAERREALVDALKAELDRRQRRAPKEALPLSERLVSLAPLAGRRAAWCHRGRAVALHANGLSAAAIEHYRRALELHTAAGEALEAARVRRSLVDVLQMSGQASAALAVGAEARRALAELGEPQLAAQLESNLGNVYFRLERFREAESCYRQAIEGFAAINDRTGRAFALYNLANVETNAHRFDSAAEHFAEAEALFSAGGLAVLAADCRYGSAYLEFRRGRYAEAQAALERSREEYAALEKPGGPALCTLDLAELFLKLEAYRDAARAARSAAEDFAELGLLAERARALYFQALAEQRLDAPAAAERALEAAAGLWRQLGNQTSAALVELERCQLAAPSPARALRLAAAAAELGASGDRFLGALGQLAQARGELDGGQPEAAAQRLQRLLSEPRDDAPLAELTAIEAWTLLGEAHQAAGRLADAEAAWQSALALAEGTYGRLARGDVRLAFFRERHPTYARLAIVRLLQRRRPVEAIEALETGRHRSLLERLDQPANPALETARARLDRELCAALDRRLAAGELGELRRARVHEETESLRQAQDELLRLARHQQPASPAPAIAFDPRLEALLAGRALAYFVADGEALWLIHGRVGALESVRLPLSIPRLSELAGALRFQLGKVRLGAAYLELHRPRLLASTERILDELGAGLFAPLLASLAPQDPLLVVPYGPLHDLPLQAALLAGQPLIERHPLVLARSLRQFAAVRSAPRPQGEIWLCGAPEPGLPAIEAELEALAAVHGPTARRLAPEELLERLAQPGPLPIAALHLAAHGSFQPEHPLFSGLRLGARFLTAFDLMRLELGGALVSLSGCETGRARRSRSDELYGPEQALLRAGAGAVVSSLWPVEDRASASAMVALHSALAAGATLAEAQRRAQLAERARDPHPFVWAAFLACGDPDLRLPPRPIRAP